MRAEGQRNAIPESRRNALLRRVDWRFLLNLREAPKTADLGAGRNREALQLISESTSPNPAEADLAALGFPRGATATAAMAALRPGGAAVCSWCLPRPRGPARARRRLERAGFVDVRTYWSGPVPNRPPEFWLPLDSPPAIAHLLAARPPRSRAQKLTRVLWRLAAAAGLLAPLCLVARAPGPGPTPSELDAALREDASWLLLTGGRRSINKVVGLAIADGEPQPVSVMKMARVPEAEAGLEREAGVLHALEQERPELSGIPRLRARGLRAGRTTVVESPIEGSPLLSALTPATFDTLAKRVSRFLVELAGRGPSQEPSEWWPRLVGAPLEDLERSFGQALGTANLTKARHLLGELGSLPIVCEQRDCAPWNVLLTGSGAPALLDWESAEPRGLPALDLIYFLANCAFVLDGALESGLGREAYAHLLDPATDAGRVASSCIEDYCAALGIARDEIPRLRLLCWIVHCRSDYRHLTLEAARPPAPEELRGALFPSLVEAELSRA